MFPTRKKVLVSFLSLTAALLLLNGPASRLQAATEISFSGSEHLGNPTDEAITINVVPEDNVYIYFEYGTASGNYTTQTPPELAVADEPHEIVISGLQADTEYYYRMRYAQTVNDSNYIARPEGNFHTARPEGSTYEFILTADSHINLQLGVLSQWQSTLGMIADDNPDFMIDLGDTFGMDGVASTAAADAAYLYQRDPDIMGLASHTVPIFLAIGNHENEEGWNFDDTNPQPVYGMRARKSYFPLPSPLTDPSFYSANTDQLEQSDVANGDYIIGDDQYRENYYAWEWGDALFVVFDPFQYTMVNPATPGAGEGNDDPAQGDRWNWTMGVEQHQWLRDTLANSDARYKFLFAHHMLGGTQNYVRGGAEAARWFEWGGCSANAPDGCTDDTHANWEFDTRRPAANGWIEPVHQLMQEYGVQAFFHGHDHQFVHEERDGIVYQLVPSGSQGTGNGFNLYTNSPYVQPGGNLGNSGYLRVTIDPNTATVEYIKTVDNNSNNIGQTIYSYTIEPNETTDPDFTITASAGPNGSINPSGTVGVTAGEDQSFTVTPNSGYQVADVLVDGGSVGAVNNFTFTDVQANHTIAASFEPASVSPGEVTVDGAASSGTADDVSSISFAHTTGTGADRLLLVGVSWNSNTAEQDITSVTFTPTGGVATNLGLVIDQQGASQPRNAAIYSLLNPPSGQTGTVTVNFSGSVASGIVAGAVNFAGVNQADPLGTAVGATGSSTAPSVELSGLDGDELVFDTLFQGASGETQTVTPGAGQSGQWNAWIANTRAGASAEAATGSSVTMSWTASSSSVWAIAAVPINPAPAGTTYELTLAVSPDGAGATDPAVGGHTYTENEVVNISATANTGYIFSGWSGDADCADGAVTMNGDKSCTANFTVAPPLGEVSIDGPVSSETADDVSSISFAHTTGTGLNRLVLVGVSWNSNTTEQDITSVTFTPDGGSAISLVEVIDQQAAAQPRNAAIYSLLNPQSGQSGTVTVTFSGSVSSGIVAGAINFAGVNQAEPLGTAVGATSTSSAEPSVTLSGLNGDELVFDTVFQGGANDSQTLTVGAGQAEQWNGFAGNNRAGASVEAAAGSSVTMSWTAASTAVWVSAVVPINPAPVGTTYDLTMASDGNGTTTPSIGVYTYAENTLVNISATPSSGYLFDSWTGDADCADGSVTMDADKSCTANFVPAPPGVIAFVGDVGTATLKDNTNNDLAVDLSSGVAVGNTIIIAYATSPNPDLTISVSDTAGNMYEQAALARNFENGRTYLFYAYAENALDSDDTITITQSVSADPMPESRSAVVSVFSGIAQNGLDQSLGNPLFEDEVMVAGTEPSVGPTGTTIQANELVFSGIGTNGPVEDAAGTWQSGYATGPRVGTTGGDAASNWTISTGWQIVSAIGQYTAGKTAVTEREYAAAIATFRADTTPPTCYTLTLEHTGNGSDPVASPSNSTGCAAGEYVEGESISLSGAVPDSGWEISGWTGTDDDASTAVTNTLTMPANAHSVSANYIEEASGLILGDANEDGEVNSTDALIILSYDADLTVTYSLVCSDVNDDGEVNSTDALIILSYDAGISVPYPIGEACVPEP